MSVAVDSSRYIPLHSLLPTIRACAIANRSIILAKLKKTADLANDTFLKVCTSLLIAIIIWPSFSLLVWYSSCAYILHQISVVYDNGVDLVSRDNWQTNTSSRLLQNIHLVSLVEWAARVLGVEVVRRAQQPPEGQQVRQLSVTEEYEPGGAAFLEQIAAAEAANQGRSSGGKSPERLLASGSVLSPIRSAVETPAKPDNSSSAKIQS